MTTKLMDPNSIQETEHPYIVRVPGISGGRPIIKKSRISVRDIAQLYKSGNGVEETILTYPNLKAAAVYDAISYYLDHQTEIEAEIQANRLENLAEKHDFSLDEQGFLRFSDQSSRK